MNAMRAFFSKFQKDQRGVTAIEYGLIAIAMAGLLSVVFASDGSIIQGLTKGYSNIAKSISKSGNSTYSDDKSGNITITPKAD